ncbi:hypothetical protein [Methylobacterium sp. A54F]
MPRRVKGDFDALTEAQLLAGLMTARRVAAESLTRTVGDAPMHRRIADLLEAIDVVAEAATGDRSFLHVRPAARPARRRPPARPGGVADPE